MPLTVQASEEFSWKGLLDFIGITATSSGQKGDDDILPGELWIVDSSGVNLRKVAIGNDYTSPIFHGEDENIFTLSKGNLIQFKKSYGLEKPIILFPLPNIYKLIDSKSSNDQLLVLDTNNSLGILSLKDKNITKISYVDIELNQSKKMINYLKGWTRDYNNTSLFIDSNTKTTIGGELEWTDIYIKNGKDKPINISQSKKSLNCTQPSFSRDKKSVVFIKEAKSEDDDFLD